MLDNLRPIKPVDTTQRKQGKEEGLPPEGEIFSLDIPPHPPNSDFAAAIARWREATNRLPESIRRELE